MKLSMGYWLIVASMVLGACAHHPNMADPKKGDTYNSNRSAKVADPFKNCTTGMFIVSADHKIEMAGCPEEWVMYLPMNKGNADPPNADYMVGKDVRKIPNPSKGQLLHGPDAYGHYYLPYDKREPRPYITLLNGEPIYHIMEKGTSWEKRPLHPAYAVNNWVSEHRKLTPFLTPAILGPPLVEMAYAKGDYLEGKPFHIGNYAFQARRLIISPLRK